MDNVVRKWTDLARSNEQDTSNAALDGTYGAGVNRIRELMPIFMNDVMKSAPSNQQVSHTILYDQCRLAMIVVPWHSSISMILPVRDTD